MHEVLVNRLGGLSLPRKSVVRLTDRPDMTLDVYRGRKTTKKSIVATCIAVHFAVCHALYNNKNKKIGKNRFLVFLNDLVLFCSVILSL